MLKLHPLKSAVIRGWLIRRCLNKGNIRLPGIEAVEDKRKLDWRNQETKVNLFWFITKRIWDALAFVSSTATLLVEAIYVCMIK